jgi:glycosyltransferase involved in cell wall biosynthesis
MIIAAVFCFLCLYSYFIYYLVKHLKKGSAQWKGLEKEPVSIVIPMRNESENIIKCLESIGRQAINNVVFEVLLIDDHSTDNSFELASNFKAKFDFKVLKSNGLGKKASLIHGIQAAKHQHIITLDSDCLVAHTWLQSMTDEYFGKKLNMLCGPLSLVSNTWFQDFQQSESAAIVGISMVSLNQNMPSTCNGANLMFSQSVFNKVGAYQGIDLVASGDDDLLMHKFCKYDIEKVAYSQNSEAMVYAKACTSFSEFIHQRARWLSKRKLYIYNYNSKIHVLMAIKLLLFYVCLIQLMHGKGIEYAMILLGLVTLDLYYAKALLSLFKINILTVVFNSLYMLYILPSFILTFVGNIQWKGRKID